MKTSIALLIALGIASQPLLAQQAQTLPQDSQPSSGTGMQPPQTLPASPSATDIQPQPDITPSSGSGASDTPAESQAGSMPDASSGDTTPMQSEAGSELRAAAPPVAELKPVVQGDVTYLCGGVGSDETDFMKREARNYDLMLTFAARNGEYLADVDVDIADARGNSVLQATCDAPIMLVDLPKSGNYKVRADAAGYTLSRTVKVATAKKQRQSVASASLVWPQQVAEGPESAPTATGDSGTGESRSGGENGNNENGAP